MKVCLLGNSASIHTQRWAMSLAEQQVDITLLSFENVLIPSINVVYLDRPRVFGKVGYLTSLSKINKFLKETKPDLLHAHYLSSYGLLGALSNYHPYVISVWGSDIFHFPNQSLLHRKLVEFSLSKADFVCSTSLIMAKEIKLYNPEIDINITPFGVDTNTFVPRASTNTIDTLTIGIVKTLEIHYGIDNLICAFSIVKKKKTSLKLNLLIVGNGSQLRNLQKLVETLNLTESVTFIPAVPHSQVPQYMQLIDIFVVPSLAESFGVAALEASACGLPVIASNVGGLPEVVVNGKTGFLVPPGDPETLAEKIICLMESPSLRSKMGRSGRQFVKDNYSWSKSLEEMQQVYKKVSVPKDSQ
jgi:L-malate glycosyltransferase